ncbi:MAG: site-specific integrase [Hungatella sp.]|nr:site-specific integrase [Hungatella sp.]
MESTSFRDYAEFWMKTVKYPILKPVSYDRLEQTYNTVCNYIGWIQVGNVTTEDIQAMINDLSATKAYSTVKKHYEFVKGVFHYAYNSQKITFDPCPAVQLPIERNMKVKTKKTEILPENITDKMYEFNNSLQESNNQSFKHMPVLLLILNTGMRIGEALALEWQDIDKNTLKVNKTLTKAKERDKSGSVVGKQKKTFSDITKTESGNRLIPLNDMAVSLLMQIKDYNRRKKIKTDYVASTADGGYVSERNILRTFKSVLGVVGAEDYTIHALRHTFASRLLKAGTEISVVSKLLGHADINTTYSTYIHVLNDQMTDVMSGISKI